MGKQCVHPLNSGTLSTHSDQKPFLAPDASETLPVSQRDTVNIYFSLKQERHAK